MIMNYKRLRYLLAIICIGISVDLAAQNTQEEVAENIHKEYLISLTEHHKQLMNSAEVALKAQQIQTIVIAIMVGVMVSIGLLLSYLQFRRDDKADASSVTTLKIGSGSIEITSSVIGLIILALSLWFFLAYVNRVYTLDATNIPAISPTQFNVSEDWVAKEYLIESKVVKEERR
ncbi:MAG: hypothetical protein OXJ90_08015 [Spirochaetaceae bacterium]|nr:hypothetical protein [Spirochaetaceae bacterium]